MNITVAAKGPGAATGTLEIGGQVFACTLGRAGIVPAAQKREGDGATPAGDFPLRQLLYRADRGPAPQTGLPLEILTPDTGWCEDPRHPDYNRKITLPHAAVHDRMTRDDALYDYTVVIGYNDAPAVPGKGSAIFLHLARPDFGPTAGCVGLKPADLQAVLRLCTPATRIRILAPA